MREGEEKVMETRSILRRRYSGQMDDNLQLRKQRSFEETGHQRSEPTLDNKLIIACSKELYFGTLLMSLSLVLALAKLLLVYLLPKAMFRCVQEHLVS